MYDYLKHAHDMLSEVRKLPEVQAWREEQNAKVARLQKGTAMGRQDKEGRPAANWGFMGTGCFEYTVIDAAVITVIQIKCVVTGDVLDLTPPVEDW